MQNKKHFSVLSITFCLLLMIAFAFAPLSVYAEEAPFEGSGTESDPYLIADKEDLYKLSELVNNGNNSYAKACYLQTNDIVLNEGTFSLDKNHNPLWNGNPIDEINMAKEWTPIGTATIYFHDTVPFSGTYNGNQYSIHGLYISNHLEEQRGLFGVTENAVLKNITIKNSLIDCTNMNFSTDVKYTGAIVGAAICTEITNCVNECLLLGGHAAGICGYGANVTISECINYADIYGREINAGILAKTTLSLTSEKYGNSGSISYCENYGNITAQHFAGGIMCGNLDKIFACVNYGDIFIVDMHDGSNSYGSAYGIGGGATEVTSCYNLGDIYVKEKNALDLAGIVRSGLYIYDCCNLGNINAASGIQASNIGGICLETNSYYRSDNDYQTGEVVGCMNLGNLTGGNDIGGICMSTPDMTLVYACCNMGNINAIGTCGGIFSKRYSDTVIAIQNCYNAGNISYNENPYDTQSAIGPHQKGGEIVNCYYLNTSAKQGIGNDEDNTSDITSLTAKEMKDKSFISMLNPEWNYFKFDDLNENGGYPIPTNLSSMPFIDVPAQSYYFTPVLWALENGITYGMGDGTFGADLNCTRAQFITFLWRAAGEPEATITQTPFTDCDVNQYYYPALLWAYENDLVAGMTETTFEPDGKITRAQVVTFLWRDAGSEIIKTTSPFTDVPSDAWYADAVTWAYSTKLASGMTETAFGPDIFSTRAHVVTFLHRYSQQL